MGPSSRLVQNYLFSFMLVEVRGTSSVSQWARGGPHLHFLAALALGNWDENSISCPASLSPFSEPLGLSHTGEA